MMKALPMRGRLSHFLPVRRPLLAIAALALFLAAFGLAARLGKGTAAAYDVDIVPSPEVARWISLGHPTLAANLLWLRAVQYMGDPRGDERGWGKLAPLLDVITDLDPRHGYAYQVGGNVLAGLGQVEASNRLLEKGTRAVPNRYILPFHRAVNALLYAGDYQEAARWFGKAADTPGAPAHLREYVVAMHVKGNQAGQAVAFLEDLLRTAADEESRKALEKQLLQARIEQAALPVDEAIARWRERYVTPPLSVSQLVQEGYLPEIPPDPAGGTWTIGEDGRVHSSVNPRRFQRPMTAEDRARELGTFGSEINRRLGAP
jgi:tetratricopeptide (TPR) repeat protein